MAPKQPHTGSEAEEWAQAAAQVRAQFMTEPKVLLDIEFYFYGGHVLQTTMEEGRDTIAEDDARYRIELHPSETETVEHIIDRSRVERMTTTRRIVEEAKVHG